MHLKFNGSYLKTTKSYDFYPVLTELNIYIVYKLSSNLNNFNFALENCLFGPDLGMLTLTNTNILDMVLDLI